MRTPALLVTAALLAGAAVVIGLLRRGGEGDGGLLVVHDQSGVIAVVDRFGTGRVEIAPPAVPGRQHAQPTWSPDGRRLGWVDAGSDTSRLVVVGADGSDVLWTELPLAPFYLSWNPAGDRLFGLGAVEGGIGGVLVAVGTDGMQVRRFADGSPFYAVWSPSGSHVLAHVGSERLVEIEPESSADETVAVPGRFRAPAWLPDGRQVFAERGTARDRLVVRSAVGEDTVLADYDGTIAFEPSGGRIAYRVEGGEPADAVAVGFIPGALPIPQGVLGVLDLDGGDRAVVSDEPVLAFQWSPDGRWLLYLTPDGGDDVDLRWNAWDGTARREFSTFTPSLLYLREYLPFFDQYTRSQTPWAPDSTAFAYAGTHQDGRAGVWVQDLDGGEPLLVAEGDMVSWAP